MTFHSISRRFSVTLIGVITLILIAFATAAIVLSVSRITKDLEAKLSGYSAIAEVSLITPLWNVDQPAVEGFIDALFLDDIIVFVKVSADGYEGATVKVRDGLQGNSFSYFAQSTQFLTTTADIAHEGEKVGTLQVAVSKAAVRQQIGITVAGTAALVVLVVAAIALTSIVTTRRFISRPLARLQRSAAAIAGGDLEADIDTGSRDEVGRLARDLNAMRESIKQLFDALQESNDQLEDANQSLEKRVEERTTQLAQANEAITALNEKLQVENLRLGAELDVTRRLQQLILPKEEELQAIDGLDVAGHTDPADEVGGDYYDVLQHNGVVKIGIGDVTGHGLESGMLMLMTQMGVRTLMNSNETDPVRFLDVLNRTIYDNVERVEAGKNLTLSLLDYSRVNGGGRLRLSGQHEDVIIVRKSGDVEIVDTTMLGFPVGLDRQIADFVDETSIELQPGDGVVLYTDGITEAKNMSRELYGLERLAESVRRHWAHPVQVVKEKVLADVRAYVGKQKILDDITLLVMKQT